MVSSGAGCEVSGAAGAVGAGSVGAGAVHRNFVCMEQYLYRSRAG